MNIWDKYQKIYDKLWVQKVSLGPTRMWVKELLLEYGLEDKKVIDIGCGTGQLLEEIQAICEAVQVLGVEPSNLVYEAENKGIDVVKTSLERLRGKEVYDYVLCTHSFPYYRDKEQAIRKLAQMTADGGYLLIAHASTNTLYDWLVLQGVKLTTSKAHYPSEQAMIKLMSPYFELKEVVKVNKWYIPSIRLYIAQKRSI